MMQLLSKEFERNSKPLLYVMDERMTATMGSGGSYGVGWGGVSCVLATEYRGPLSWLVFVNCESKKSSEILPTPTFVVQVQGASL